MRPLGRIMMSLLPVSLQFLAQRALLTPTIRLCAFVVLPVSAGSIAAAVWLSDDLNREWLAATYMAAEHAFKFNDSFKVAELRVNAELPELRRLVRSNVGFTADSSPFDIDPQSIKSSLEDLPAVLSATVTIVPGGDLEIMVRERKAEVVLRRGRELLLLDRHGGEVFSGDVSEAVQELPLITGAGAGSHVEEALQIYLVAAPIRHSVRGLVRIGDRRWDLALDGGRIVRLPESGALAALDHLLAFDRKEAVLARDFEIVDLRLPEQVVIRLSPEVFTSVMDKRAETGGNT